MGLLSLHNNINTQNYCEFIMNIYEALFEHWLLIILSDYIYLFEVKLDQNYTKKGENVSPKQLSEYKPYCSNTNHSCLQ